MGIARMVFAAASVAALVVPPDAGFAQSGCMTASNMAGSTATMTIQVRPGGGCIIRLPYSNAPITVVQSPQQGTVEGTNTTFTYRANRNATGTDSFTVRGQTAGQATAGYTFSIHRYVNYDVTVQIAGTPAAAPGNPPPAAGGAASGGAQSANTERACVYTAQPHGLATLRVRRDRDCRVSIRTIGDGRVTIEQRPRNGVSTSEGNYFTYRPNPGFAGEDTLVVRWPLPRNHSSGEPSFRRTITVTVE